MIYLFLPNSSAGRTKHEDAPVFLGNAGRAAIAALAIHSAGSAAGSPEAADPPLRRMIQLCN